MSNNLFGVPSAEIMHDDPAEVYETDIREWIHDDTALDTVWTIEEWTARRSITYAPSREHIAEWIAEHAADEMDEHAAQLWSDAAADDVVLGLIGEAVELMASKVPYRMADEKIAEHKVTLVDGDLEAPLIDGEPMYRAAAHMEATS